MLKFKFNYQNNTLAYQKHDLWYQISEEQQFTPRINDQISSDKGFKLTGGWIIFTIYENKIRVFYKQINSGEDLTNFWEPQTPVFYRKDLPKECPVIFEFSEKDEVKKVEGRWIKKGVNHE